MTWVERAGWIAGVVLLMVAVWSGLERHSMQVGRAVAAECAEWKSR